jgi:organic hydroperoxide reductase OsmC/OhrA
MGKDAEGRVYMARTVLRPAVRFAGQAPDPETLNALHHKAHTECFIANSVRGEVSIEHTQPG